MGASNDGYLGISVSPGFYTSSFFIKGDYDGEVTLRLNGKSSGIQYAWATIAVTSVSSKFTQYSTGIWTPEVPDGDIIWILEFASEKVAGSSLNIGLPQLFPPTFNNRSEVMTVQYQIPQLTLTRENGLNPKFADPLAELKPKFLRFPGGNDL